MSTAHSLYPRPFRRLKTREIRLLKLEKGRGKDDVHCSLHYADLDEEPHFEALSYTWASEHSENDCLPTQSISLEGFEGDFMVTRNCMAALRSIRLPQASRCVWIDSICIWQEHGGEKTHQIGLMAEIYSKATRVLAYIGDNIQDHESLLHIMRSETVDFSNLRGAQDEKTVKAFFRKPYFSRLWVIQEIVLAKAVDVFFAGKHVLFSSWDNQWLHRIAKYENAPPWLDMALEGSEAANRKETSTLSEILAKTRAAKCSEPRDKILAVLGFFDDDPLDLRTDQGSNETAENRPLSTSDIFTRAAAYIMKNEPAYPILRLASSLHLQPGLPTWVPNWASTSTYALWHHDSLRWAKLPQRNTRVQWDACFDRSRPSHDALQVPFFNISYEPGYLYLKGHVAWGIAGALTVTDKYESDIWGFRPVWKLVIHSEHTSSQCEVLFDTPPDFHPTSNDFIFIRDTTHTPYIIRRCPDESHFNFIAESSLLVEIPQPSGVVVSHSKSELIELTLTEAFWRSGTAAHDRITETKTFLAHCWECLTAAWEGNILTVCLEYYGLLQSNLSIETVCPDDESLVREKHWLSPLFGSRGESKPPQMLFGLESLEQGLVRVDFSKQIVHRDYSQPLQTQQRAAGRSQETFEEAEYPVDEEDGEVKASPADLRRYLDSPLVLRSEGDQQRLDDFHGELNYIWLRLQSDRLLRELSNNCRHETITLE